jgi:hypothetical protein
MHEVPKPSQSLSTTAAEFERAKVEEPVVVMGLQRTPSHPSQLLDVVTTPVGLVTVPPKA